MESILPTIPGLDINGLLYKYTTVKKARDDMKVHVVTLVVKDIYSVKLTIGLACREIP